MKKQNDFYNLFFKAEWRVLNGKNFRNSLILFIIIFLTFVGIGFGVGGLKYLERKMSDPYVNWLNIYMGFSGADQINTIVDKLNNTDSLKQKYSYDNVSAYAEFDQYFNTVDGKDIRQAKCRTIDQNSPLLEKIFSNEFLISGIEYNELELNKYFSENSIGVIVTEEFLKKLGYTDFPPFINLSYPINEEDVNEVQYQDVPIPIIAVVANLPGMADIISSQYFYYMAYYDNTFPLNINTENHLSKISFFVPNLNAQKVSKQVVSMINKQYPSLIDTDPDISTGTFLTYQKGEYVTISFIKSIRRSEMDKIDLAAQGVYQFYEFEKNHRFNNSNLLNNNISVYFQELSKIKSFQDYVFKEFQIRLDLANIDAKENFNFISKLSYATLFLLIAFSTLSVVIFINNLFRNHVDKIKKNLGTFKAFGLNNKQLISVYLLISFSLIFSASVVALLFASTFGYLGGIRLVLSMLGVGLELGNSYFDLYNTYLLLAVFFIFISSVCVVFLKIKNTLKKTPGDLIFERD